jgi:hypothetical protein
VPGSVPLGGKGFVLFGHEGSCQLLGIEFLQLSQQQLTLRLRLEEIRVLLGKYKDIMSWFLGGPPSKPLFAPTILYKISYGTQTFPHCWTDKCRWRSPF